MAGPFFGPTTKLVPNPLPPRVSGEWQVRQSVPKPWPRDSRAEVQLLRQTQLAAEEATARGSLPQGGSYWMGGGGGTKGDGVQGARPGAAGARRHPLGQPCRLRRVPRRAALLRTRDDARKGRGGDGPFVTGPPPNALQRRFSLLSAANSDIGPHEGLGAPFCTPLPPPPHPAVGRLRALGEGRGAGRPAPEHAEGQQRAGVRWEAQGQALRFELRRLRWEEAALREANAGTLWGGWLTGAPWPGGEGARRLGWEGSG